MRTKKEYEVEKEVLIQKGLKILISKPSGIPEIIKIMLRLNYIKGILFALSEDSE